MINKLITLLLFTLFAACPNAQAMKHISKVFRKPQSYKGLRAEYIETKKKNAETLTQAANLLTKEEASTSLMLHAKATEEYYKGVQLKISNPDKQKIKSILKDDKEAIQRSDAHPVPVEVYIMLGTFASLAIIELDAHGTIYMTSTLAGTLVGAAIHDHFMQRRKKVANYKKEWLHEKIKSIEQGTNSQDKTAEKHS